MTIFKQCLVIDANLWDWLDTIHDIHKEITHSYSSFIISDCYQLSFINVPYCLQCFDAAGWAAGRASGL